MCTRDCIVSFWRIIHLFYIGLGDGQRTDDDKRRTWTDELTTNDDDDVTNDGTDGSTGEDDHDGKTLVN